MNISMRMLQLRGKTNELMLRFPAAVCWQVIGFFVGAAIILLRPGGTENTAMFDHLIRLIPALAGAWLRRLLYAVSSQIQFPSNAQRC